MKKILFVCLGNICRSPVAEGIAKSLYPDLFFDSSGTGSWHTGEKPDGRSMEICKKYGIDISDQVARPLRFTDPEEFDLIIGMDRQNILDLKRILPENYHYKIQMFDKTDVQDPYYGGVNGFEKMFDQIKTVLEKRDFTS